MENDELLCDCYEAVIARYQAMLAQEAARLDSLMAAVLAVGDRKTLEATGKVLDSLRLARAATSSQTLN